MEKGYHVIVNLTETDMETRADLLHTVKMNHYFTPINPGIKKKHNCEIHMDYTVQFLYDEV